MRNWLWGLVLLGLPLYAAQTADELFARAKQERDLNRQVELLTQVIKKSPRHVGAYHRRADAYEALGKRRQALQDYNRVVSLRPKDPFRYYARGLAYVKRGENTQALADFSKAISLKPTHKDFYLARARAYSALEKNGSALLDYKKFAGSWAKLSPALLHEVIPVSLQGYRYDEAQAQVDALQAQGDDGAQVYYWQGRIWQSEGRLDEAVSAYSKSIHRNDADWQVYRYRGNTFKEMGDYEAALEDYSRVLALQPEAYWFNRRGLVYEELKDLDKAAADYTRAIELDPKWPIAYNNRGYIKMQQKDWAGAQADFQTAIKLDPAAPTPHVNLAGVYWLSKKDRKKMYASLEKALKCNFTNFESLFDEEQKGWMFKGVNQTAEFRSMLYK